MMKQITIFLSDDEWKELVETVSHEIGELKSGDAVERKVQDDVLGYIRNSYIHGLGI